MNEQKSANDVAVVVASVDVDQEKTSVEEANKIEDDNVEPSEGNIIVQDEVVNLDDKDLPPPPPSLEASAIECKLAEVVEAIVFDEQPQQEKNEEQTTSKEIENENVENKMMSEVVEVENTNIGNETVVENDFASAEKVLTTTDSCNYDSVEESIQPQKLLGQKEETTTKMDLEEAKEEVWNTKY